MNRSLHLALSALVLLIVIVACVLPGQAGQPIPTLDPGAVETAVAGTAQAAAQQTEQAAPQPTAPAQPVATDPPTPLPTTGTAIEQLPDGAIKYSDYDAGFEMIFPAGWLTVRANSQEFNDALVKEGAANSMLRDQMTDDLAEYNPNFHQLYSYILRPDIAEGFMFGYTRLEWDPTIVLPIDEVTMKKLAKALEDPQGIGFHADTTQVRQDTQVKMIEISGPATIKDEQGGTTTTIYMTMIVFKPVSNSTVQLMFTFMGDYYEKISPDVKSALASIRLIGSQQ